MPACIGRYCECRYHLAPDIPAWAIETYKPSPMAQSVLHAMWEEGRTEPTAEERAIAWAELQNLADGVHPILRDPYDLDDDERGGR